MSYLKLRELWDECEKLKPETLDVFFVGLIEIREKRSPSYAKTCVARRGKKLKLSRKDWTEAEEAMLKKCCEGVSVAKGAKIFREKTGSSRTAGACKFRVYEMRLGGRW